MASCSDCLSASALRGVTWRDAALFEVSMMSPFDWVSEWRYFVCWRNYNSMLPTVWDQRDTPGLRDTSVILLSFVPAHQKETVHVILTPTARHAASRLSAQLAQNCNCPCYLRPSNNMTYGNQLSRCGVFAIVQTWDCLDLGASSVLCQGVEKESVLFSKSFPQHMPFSSFHYIAMALRNM